MKTPCMDCQTIELCAAEGFECGHDDVERAPMVDMRSRYECDNDNHEAGCQCPGISRRTPDEMIVELQMKVHLLEKRLEALEAHKHTVAVDPREYPQAITTSGICYVMRREVASGQ